MLYEKIVLVVFISCIYKLYSNGFRSNYLIKCMTFPQRCKILLSNSNLRGSFNSIKNTGKSLLLTLPGALLISYICLISDCLL